MTAREVEGHAGEARSRVWATHQVLSHTGEIELALRASDLASLYAEAARALAELMTGGQTVAWEGAPELVTVRGRDAAALLVAWLNELIFLSETRKRVYGHTQVESCGEGQLSVRVRGGEPAFLKTQVKAATLHRALVERAPDGVRARVVLDV
jgi:SHS2 domain-containing protein